MTVIYMTTIRSRYTFVENYALMQPECDGMQAAGGCIRRADRLHAGRMRLCVTVNTA